MRRAVSVVGLLLATLVPAGTAQAACTSSTPSTVTFADSPADGDLGLAPEILSVVAATDGACRLAVQDVIAGAVGPGDLIDGDAVGIYLDTDGNPATGSPLWDGADRVAITVGLTGPDIGPGLGVWNGSTFDFASAPAVVPVGAAGFAATIDQLGMQAPAAVGIRTATLWTGVYDVYGDLAPEAFASPFRFAVAFSTAAPAPPPPRLPVPQPPVVAPPATPTTACTVPRLKRLRSASARRRLRNAGCRYRFVHVRSRLAAGRVISTRPGAGRRTSGTVVVRISRGRARRAVASSATATAFAATERSLSRHAAQSD
jgi:hypothetical protein